MIQNDLRFPQPFTLDDYRYLVRLARDHYQFVFYDRAGEKNNPEPIVFWRHDIDFSPSRAVQLAEIEAQEGVRSTYFIHLHSAFYHFWEPHTVGQIRRLTKLGHQIGLHFDSHFYGKFLGNNLPMNINQEAMLLQDLVAQPIRVFSFHNTTPHILETYTDKTISGLVNVYSDYFRNQVHYVSDSFGIWRYEDLHTVLEKHEHTRLHVLTHPGWWTKDAMTPEQRVTTCLKERSQVTSEHHYQNLQNLQRKSDKSG